MKFKIIIMKIKYIKILLIKNIRTKLLVKKSKLNS